VLGTSPAASVSVWWIPQKGCCQGRRRNIMMTIHEKLYAYYVTRLYIQN